MTSTTRISDLPAAASADGAQAAVVQASQTRRYALGSAARRDAGTSAGSLPILGASGAVSTADGGTGLSIASPGANKVFGTDASGNPALRDLPGGTPSIADRSITAAKLADDAVITRTIADDAIGRDQIKDGEVIAGKLGAASVASANVADGAIGTQQIAAHAITTGKYANASVTHAALADRSVRVENFDISGGTDGQVLQLSVIGGVRTFSWADKGDLSLADGSVTRPKIADDAVDQSKLADDSVGAAQLIDASVGAAALSIAGTPTGGQAITWDATNSRLAWATISGGGGVPADGSITTQKLADDAVTAAKIDNGAIANAAVAANAAIDLSKLNISGTPTAGQVIKRNSANTGFEWADDAGLASIPDLGITTAKLANAAVTTAKIGSEQITDAKVKDVAFGKLTGIGGTQASGKLLGATSSSAVAWVDAPDASIGDGAVDTEQLADDAVTAAKIDNGAVVNAALAAGAVSTNKIAPGAVSVPTLAVSSADLQRPGGVLMKTADGVMAFVDPLAPPVVQYPAWGSGVDSANVPVSSADLTTIVSSSSNPELYVVVGRTFNATTLDLNSAVVKDIILAPNANSADVSQVKVAGTTFYGGMFARSSGTNHVYVSITNSGSAYFVRVGGVWSQVNAFTTSSSVKTLETLPQDGRWYLMRVGGDFARYGLGRRSTDGTERVAVALFFNSDRSAYKARYYLGENVTIHPSFRVGTSEITTSKIADGAVGESKLAALSVSSGKLASGAVSGGKIADGAVSSTKLGDDSVILSKINAGNKVAGYHLAINSAGTALVFAAPPSGGTPANNSITAAMLQSNSVTQAKIASGAVGSGELASNAVQTAKVGDRQITTSKIAQKAVNWGEIADNAIRTLQINNDAVTQAKIASGAVGSTELATNAVGSSEIASNAVIRAKIAADAIDGTKIADDAVGIEHLNTSNAGTTGQRLERTSSGMRWADAGGGSPTTTWIWSSGNGVTTASLQSYNFGGTHSLQQGDLIFFRYKSSSLSASQVFHSQAFVYHVSSQAVQLPFWHTTAGFTGVLDIDLGSLSFALRQRNLSGSSNDQPRLYAIIRVRG